MSTTIELSKKFRRLEYSLGTKPCELLYHELTGDYLLADKPVKMLLKELSHKNKTKAENLKNLIKANSDKRLIELFEKNFLVPKNTADEFELFLDYYPIRRKTILYTEKEGKIELTWAKPSEVITNNAKIIISKLNPIETEIFKGAESGYSLKEIINNIAHKNKLTKEAAYLKVKNAWMTRLGHPDFQFLKLSLKPLSFWKSEFEMPPYFFEFVNSRGHSEKVKKDKKKALKDGQIIDLKDFHLKGIKNAFAEFDDVETTVSHALRFPTSILGGRTYGGAFYDRCRYLKEGTQILEVGGGTGIFANCFLNRAYEQDPELAKTYNYKILDLAPVLQDSQKKINKKFMHQMEFIQANAESMNLKRKSIDLLISNEVIADFRACKLNLKSLTRSTVERQTLKLIEKYNIDINGAPETFYFNLGAVLFLENVFKVLNKNGIAMISEFGGVADYPEPTTHLNHDEYSIHWGHLTQVAKRLGFKKVKLIDLQSFIQINPYEEAFSGDIGVLSYLLKKSGINLKKAVYTKSELEKLIPKQVKGLSFAPFHQRRSWAPDIEDFKILILRK